MFASARSPSTTSARTEPSESLAAGATALTRTRTGGYTQFSMLWYLDKDYEYGGRWIVGKVRLLRNGKSSCLGKGCHTVGETTAPVTSS